MELDAKRPCVLRFNMPFEVGLAAGMEAHGDHTHYWYAFEEKKYRALKSLSDLNGTEVYAHGGRRPAFSGVWLTPWPEASTARPLLI